MFKRRRSPDATQASLPNERKALAERYTIDAGEAEARAQREAEAHAAGEPGAQQAAAVTPVRVEVEPERDALAATAHVQQAPQPEAPLDHESAPEPLPEPESREEPTEDLPVYVWLRRVEPATPDASERLRELVRAKEARSEPRDT